jgi:hypothetical protein
LYVATSAADELPRPTACISWCTTDSRLNASAPIAAVRSDCRPALSRSMLVIGHHQGASPKTSVRQCGPRGRVTVNSVGARRAPVCADARPVGQARAPSVRRRLRFRSWPGGDLVASAVAASDGRARGATSPAAPGRYAARSGGRR